MMNLKYYLRGLGIGVVVTALIMGILAGKGEALSDEEIIERAKALGMTMESDLLADTLASYEEEVQEQIEESGLPPSEGGDEAGPEENTDPAAEAGEEQAPMEAKSPEPDQDRGDEAQPVQDVQEIPETEETDMAQEIPASEDSGAETGNFTIEINSGDSSYGICQKLEDAGLVETATAFDRYLFENGYDKRINTGVFEIPRDADMEKIAKILSRME